MRNSLKFEEMLEEYLPKGHIETDRVGCLSKEDNHNEPFLADFNKKKRKAHSVTIRSPEKINDCCVSGDGTKKNIYSTRYEAEAKADFLYEERGVSLRVYGCKHHPGWHLTKE